MEMIASAEVLLVLDTGLSSDEFESYISCYKGDKLILIKEREEYSDIKADYFIYDKSQNVLPKLGYNNIVMFDNLEAVNK